MINLKSAEGVLFERDKDTVTLFLFLDKTHYQYTLRKRVCRDCD